MKHIGLTLLSLLWLLLTFILTITIVGVIAFFVADEKGKIYWFEYGKKLLDELCS